MTLSEYVDQFDPSASSFGTVKVWFDKGVEDMSEISAGPITCGIAGDWHTRDL
jgi:hypothetical protein